MKNLNLLVLLMLFGFFSSCDNGAVIEDLDVAKTKWQSLNPSKYKFDYSYGCECLMDFIPAEIVVENGVVTEINNPTNGQAFEYSNGTAVIDSLPWGFYTMNELFNKLDEANGEAFRIDTEFNDLDGYPTYIYIDWNEEVNDDEISYSVSEFEVL